MAESSDDITRMLNDIQNGLSSGQRQAMAQTVYAELRRIARRKLGGHWHDRTLDTTALVNEAWLKLNDNKEHVWQNRGHFYAVAATAMRQIIIDEARRKLAQKRDGVHVEEDVELAAQDVRRAEELLAVERTLEKLAAQSPEQALVFECKYFMGLSNEELAQALELSVRSVERRWQQARERFKTLYE